MSEVILIILFVCGQPDTFIIKEPNLRATYIHDFRAPEKAERILGVFEKGPIIIQYNEERGYCA